MLRVTLVMLLALAAFTYTQVENQIFPDQDVGQVASQEEGSAEMFLISFIDSTPVYASFSTRATHEIVANRLNQTTAEARHGANDTHAAKTLLEKYKIKPYIQLVVAENRTVNPIRFVRLLNFRPAQPRACGITAS